MPKYDFKCENCGIIEIIKSMLDPNPEECPDCGEPITRHFAPTKALYRGSGFFTTDKALYDIGKPDRYDQAVIDNEFD
jgi:putative FmdB family regulatory protein